MVKCPKCGNYPDGYPDTCPYCGYLLLNSYGQAQYKHAKSMFNFIAGVFTLLVFISIGWIIISYFIFHDVNYIGIILLILSCIMLFIMDKL